jgi:hypothetical protein
MDRLSDLTSDFDSLNSRLDTVLAEIDDPESRTNGSDAAAIVRERRALGEIIFEINPSFDRVTPLRLDYDRLGEALDMVGGSSSAVLVRERRLISALLEQLEVPKVVPLVDELAKRRAESGTIRPPARSRKSR